MRYIPRTTTELPMFFGGRKASLCIIHTIVDGNGKNRLAFSFMFKRYLYFRPSSDTHKITRILCHSARNVQGSMSFDIHHLQKIPETEENPRQTKTEKGTKRTTRSLQPPSVRTTYTLIYQERYLQYTSCVLSLIHI